MVLQTALLVLAASTFQAPAAEPAASSVLLRDCDLTEEQVLELAVPGYAKKSALSKAHEADELNEYLFDAVVVAARATDLGLGKGLFLVAVIGVHTGYCNCCHEGRLVVIDLAGKQVAWSAETKGAVWMDEASGQLRLFHLFPDDGRITVAVRSSFPCGEHGGRSETETWYRPMRASADTLLFQTIWEGDLENGSPGGWVGPRAEECGQIQSLWPRRAYQYVVHDLAGWIATTPTEEEQTIATETPCREAEDDFGAVDFISTSVLTPAKTTLKLGSERAPTLERRDLRPTLTFPFNLPVRRLFMDMHRLEAAATSKDLTEVQAPGCEFVASFPKRRNMDRRKVLEIHRVSDSRLVRQIPAPEWADESQRPEEYGELSFRSVGWSRDGRRCLAVVEVGLRFGPVLVSLTVDGKGDAWEGLLPRDKADLGDGFVLDLPEPPPTRASPSTKNP